MKRNKRKQAGVLWQLWATAPRPLAHWRTKREYRLNSLWRISSLFALFSPLPDLAGSSGWSSGKARAVPGRAADFHLKLR